MAASAITVAGAAGVLLGNKMTSASMDTGRVIFPSLGSGSRIERSRFN
jgi:hypothetical protein